MSRQIRRVELHEWREATKTLVTAFANDPVAHYLTRCDGKTLDQARALDWDLLSCVIYAHLLRGHVYAIKDTSDSGGFAAVALWIPPGHSLKGWWPWLRSGQWRLSFRLGTESKHRYFDELGPKLTAARLQVLGPELERTLDYWYLMYIGTVPSARGKGYARALVEHVTQLADEQGVKCYLEASTRANVPVYEKFGFRTGVEVALERETEPVPVVCMVRETTTRS